MIVKYFCDEIEKNEKAIVLCGPTDRKNKTEWRKQAIKILENLNFDGTIYIPEPNIKNFENYIEQVEWERNCYIYAKVILFWVPRKFPDMPGLTTNVEFGYWLSTKKCIYGRPDWAERIRYLDWLYELEYNKKPFNNLEELLKEAINLAEIGD